MKKTLSLFVALCMIMSVFAALPIVSSAEEITLTASASYTHSSTKNTAVTMHGNTTRPYALSWTSNSDGYRTGYIAFPFGDADLSGQTISKATLNLTVSKTQNMNESNSAFVLYAVDFDEINQSGTAPTSDILLATVTPPSAVQSQGDYTHPMSIDIDLTEYLETYPSSKGVGIMITNRDDKFSYRGMIGFYGYNEGEYAPKLSLEYGAEASVSVTITDADGIFVDQKDFTGLFAGDEFAITEDIAPMVIRKGNDSYPVYCAREDIAPVTLKPGINTINVTYSNIEIVSADEDFEVFPILGKPALPKSLSVTTADGRVLLAPVVWVLDPAAGLNPAPGNDPYPETFTEVYKADLGAITVEKEIECYSNDSYLKSFTSSGNSDGADFGKYNDLELSIGGGTAIFDTEFIVESGNNMLIMYGDETTTEFNKAGALVRMFSADTFEYYNNGWLASDIKCEYNTPYLLRTEVDVTNKTYSLYIAKEGNSSDTMDSFETLVEGATFRNTSLPTVSRMFVSGNIKMSEHFAYWADGSSYIVVSSVDEFGQSIADDYVLKCTTDSTYTASYLPKFIDTGYLYVLKDVNMAPSIKVTEGAKLEIPYTKVTINTYNPITTVVVQGDSTVNLPAEVKITFSDGQTVPTPIEWNLDYVNLDVVGTYTAVGTISGTDSMETIEATVKVRQVTNLPKSTENTVVTNNGGWNWYVEPSGTHIQPGDELATRYESGQYTSNGGYKFKYDKTYMGWVEDEGTIVVSEYDHDNDTHTRVELHPFLESDDHNNPAVVVLPDGRIMVFYSMHTNEPYMYYCVTKNPEDISKWNQWQRYYCYTEADGRTYNATYPSVFIVHDDEGIIGNDVIYVGWRGVHWKPTFAKFSIPDENGVCEMVMNQTQFANTTYGYSTYDGNDAPNAKNDGGYTDSGRRPYTKYDYDFDRNKIYITFTANHPDNDKRNHIYYIYLDIEDQNLYTAKDNLLQPLPKENNASYKSQGAMGTNGQWGIITVDLVDDFPELLVFDASEQTGQSFNPRNGNAERRGWTWDIKVNEKGEPCIVYVDVTATPPGEDGSLPTWYVGESNGNSRSHHYYWYARWDSETQNWVKTFLTYGGKWFHENATQERCYSGGLTFDHNYDASVIYLAIPTMGEYGNIFEIYRWETEDNGATWTIREPLTENSKINNARPNAIYNYKQNPDGTNAGPRLLWISGEYRYWMNYEYKTGVMTDFAADGFITKDSPEMFADAFLYANGEKTEILPTGENISVTGKFVISNTSIGDGNVYLALAHYDKDNLLKNVVTERDVTIPARSVPQIGMVGAPKQADGTLSPMGDEEIEVEIPYTSTFNEGDRIVLLAWNSGIEHQMSSIISIPFSTTTEKNKYAMTETFNYDGTEKLILDDSLTTFNGWIGKAYNSNALISDKNYAAITKAPFGNTALHLYRTTSSNGAIMASHALPDTNGKDYTIRFTMRYINEMSWNNTDNAGFTLSHGVPVYNDPITPCALQFRHRVVWQEENGRGTSGHVRNTRWFDGSSMSQIFVETDGPDNVGFKNDALMVGALYTVEINVHPEERTIDFSINDGHRTFYVTRDYVDKTSHDWSETPIDTITFSIGNEKYGEIYVDNLSVEIAE